MLRDLIYSDLLARGRTEAIAKEWGAIAAEFETVCGLKDKYGREDVVRFVAHLRKRGLQDTTIHKDLKAIRLLCQIQPERWPETGFPKLAMRRIRQDEIKRPKFGKEQLISLVTMGRSLLDEVELAYLALASTYGMRRAELAKLALEDISPEELKIRTVHEGPWTSQLVPPEIRPYIGCLKRPRRPDTLTHIFHRIMLKTGFHVQRGFGWHSIRRTLATELILSEAPAINVIRFMRWSEASVKGEFGMLAIYAAKDQLRIDQQIFLIHPFLPYWGTGEETIREREKVRKLDIVRKAVAVIEAGELEGDEIAQLIEMVRRAAGGNPRSLYEATRGGHNAEI